jgi:chromosome segregation ATPase
VSHQIERLEGEVEQWMVASEQLQKLGEEAVAEVSEEAESLREEVITLTQKYEEEVHRRREVEAELAQRTLSAAW